MFSFAYEVRGKLQTNLVILTDTVDDDHKIVAFRKQMLQDTSSH